LEAFGHHVVYYLGVEVWWHIIYCLSFNLFLLILGISYQNFNDFISFLARGIKIPSDSLIPGVQGMKAGFLLKQELRTHQCMELTSIYSLYISEGILNFFIPDSKSS